MEKFGEFGGKKRKERKRKKEKKMKKGRYFLGRKSGNNYSGGFPGFGCGCGKLSENTEIVPKSSISERPAKILKNQEYYSKNHGEIRFKKYFIVFKLKILESAANIGRRQIWQKFDKF